MLSQIIAVTGLNLRSIRERLGSSAVAIFGIVGVVVVFVGVLSVAEGFHAAMQATGDNETVMVMRSGADSEMTSGLSGEHARIIQDKPCVARDAQGPLGVEGLGVHRPDDDADGVVAVPDPLDEVDAVAGPQRDVHDRHVRLRLLEQAEGLGRVVGLAADRQVRLPADAERQRLAHRRVVVDDQHPGPMGGLALRHRASSPGRRS